SVHISEHHLLLAHMLVLEVQPHPVQFVCSELEVTWAPQPNSQQPTTNNRVSSGLRQHRLSALRAAPCLDRNIAQTFWTLLTGWTRRSITAMHASNERVDWSDHKKIHRRGNQQE